MLFCHCGGLAHGAAGDSELSQFEYKPLSAVSGTGAHTPQVAVPLAPHLLTAVEAQVGYGTHSWVTESIWHAAHLSAYCTAVLALRWAVPSAVRVVISHNASGEKLGWLQFDKP